MNILGHWFWTLLTAACLLWYLTITFLVAYRGFIDIRVMLARLKHSYVEQNGKKSVAKTD